VYCHNPSPFYKLPWHEARLEPKLWLFNRFYSRLYGTFIFRNDWVIVQQEWIRQAFIDRFGPLPVVVAHPDVKLAFKDCSADKAVAKDTPRVLLYPTLPRVFKNIETVMAAMQRLANNGHSGLELRVTISGDENSYARWLYQRFHATPGVNFIGRQSPTQMVEQYQAAHAVIFPSKLETWGLPISEAKAWNKPLLVADLPYARETVGSYTQAAFVSATHVDAWMHEFKSLALDEWTVLPTIGAPVLEPYSPSWSALWERLATGL
jgi:glycosyltransferase involved in cell wall biosynthesis